MGRVVYFASNFDGQCLSFSPEGQINHISIVKGEQALKFKCMHGHAFYKFVSELLSSFNHYPHLFGIQRKGSSSTMASSSDEEDDFSKIWCPKCVAFYRNCQSTARSYNFSLVGKIYSSKLYFCCPRSKHLTKISYSRRLNTNIALSCANCLKQEREVLKTNQKIEEQQQSEYLSKIQEELFQKAKAAM